MYLDQLLWMDESLQEVGLNLRIFLGFNDAG
jgi:hypothetical protein